MISDLSIVTWNDEYWDGDTGTAGDTGDMDEIPNSKNWGRKQSIKEDFLEDFLEAAAVELNFER